MSAGKKFHEWVSTELIYPQASTDLILASYLCGYHVLLEGAPGLGKTTIARALGEVVGDMGRIQMTSDLSPSDILGWEMPTSSGQELVLKKGPIFHKILLVDEINRAMPRTQSALLESMEERHVSIGGQRHPLPEDFFVIATQNPFDMDGTYLLPHSQLDRFGVTLRIEVPKSKSLGPILEHHFSGSSQRQEKGSPPQLEDLKVNWQNITVDADWYRVSGAMQDWLIEEAENGEKGALALSPRAWLAWINLARCLSAIRGHSHLSTKSLRDLIEPVFLHRMEAFSDRSLGESLHTLFDELTGQK